MDDIGEVYNAEIYDFCLHKKRAKEMGLLTYTEDYKSFFTAEQAIALAAASGAASQRTLGNATGEVYVGSLKVKVLDNLYLCPDCDKTFRKENHLQIHIKHYHKETATLLGVCPNMQDLAYLRTADSDPQQPEIQTKFVRKSLQSGVTPTTSPAAVAALIKTESGSSSKVGRTSESKRAIKEEVDSKDFRLLNLLSTSSKFDSETSPVSRAVGKSKFKRSKHFRNRSYERPMKIKKLKLNESDGVTDSNDTQFSFNNDESFQNPYISKLSDIPYVNEFGEVIKIVRMRKEEIINCICSYPEADGLMMQCELCLAWQHSICNGIVKESDVPEKYVCLICKNPQSHRPSMRFIHDQDWLFDGKLPAASYTLHFGELLDRSTILQDSHTLTGNLLELQTFLNSLRIKMNMAANKDHPKMYLWSSKWETATHHNQGADFKSYRQAVDGGNGVAPKVEPDSILAGLLNDKNHQAEEKYVVPPREEAIDPIKCQLNLLNHIQKQQSFACSRLNDIEAKINGKCNE